MVRLLLIAGIVLTGLAGRSDACPPGPCNKYRLRVPPVVTPTPTGYTRTVMGAPPAGYTRVVRFLAASTWDPMPTPVPPGTRALQPPRLRFVVAADARRLVDTSLRTVLLRRIERRDGMTLVEVDGDVFELARCGTRQRPMACLTRRSDITLDEPELDVVVDVGVAPGGGGGFAQPPP